MSEGSQNPFHDVTIHQNEWGEVRSIELDGFDVKGLVDFRINSPMREIPTLQITLRINELEVGDPVDESLSLEQAREKYGS